MTNSVFDQNSSTVKCGTMKQLTRGFTPFLDSREYKYCILVNYSHYYYYILMGFTTQSEYTYE